MREFSRSVAALLVMVLVGCGGSGGTTEPQAQVLSKVDLNVFPGSSDPASGAARPLLNGNVLYVPTPRSGNDTGLLVFNVANPRQPRAVDGFSDRALYELALANNRLFGVDGSALVVFDISDPFQPVEIAYIPLGGNAAYTISASGNRVYVGGGGTGLGDGPALQVIDVSDPLHPVVLGASAEVGGIDIEVVGDRAYVASYSAGLRIYDVSNPASPALLGSTGVAMDADRVLVKGSLAYLYSSASGSLSIVDAGNAAAPVLRGHAAGAISPFMWWSPPSGFALVGNRAYVGKLGGLQVFDIASPAAPVSRGCISLGETVAGLVVKEGVLLGAGESALTAVSAGIGGPCDDVVGGFQDEGAQRLGGVRIGTYPMLGNVGDRGRYPHRPLWHQGFVYQPVSSYEGGVLVFDARTPSAPRLVANPVFANALELAAVDSRLFAVDGERLAVIDISTPARPVLLSSTALAGVGDSGSVALAVAARGQHVFVSGASTYHGTGPALQAIDVSNPEAPVVLDRSTEAGGLDVTLAGNYAYVAASGQGLRIFDISDPANLVQVAQVSTGGWAAQVEVVDGFAYVRIGMNLGNSSGRSLSVVDVRHPLAPALLATVPLPADDAPYEYGQFMGLQVAGNRAYLASMAGVMVADITTPSAPVFVGRIGLAEFTGGMTLNGNVMFAASRSGLTAMQLR
ncbi:MAG: hypothetical protein K0Q68_572 [Moraxellaceae bacterium]|jgi:hypothetical protein|nr:hypothetical protein [Moraxellaceae bacterium]